MYAYARRNFDVNQRDAHGATALHYALDSRRFSRAKTLLEVGAGMFGVSLIVMYVRICFAL